MEKNNIYAERMEKIRNEMVKKGIDIFFISPSSNLFYLTGYDIGPDERLFLLVLPANGQAFILANVLYKEQVAPLPVDDQLYWKDGEDPFELLKTEIAKRSLPVKKAALEPQIPALFSLPLSKMFMETTFILGSPLSDPFRKIKDQSELDRIRKACKISDKALTALIGKTCETGSYWIGKTESEFLTALYLEMRSEGIYDFGGSIQVGMNAAIPHYITGNSLIKKGTCLLCDFWGRYEGYFTDCTRTFHFGKPEKEFEKIHSIVREAQLAAEEKAKPGNTLEEVDLAARTTIEKYGYGEYFTHRTGHGLGIDVHEGDSVNKGVNIPIEKGMVFSIEPGIYLPGRFGARIENLVAVGENNPEILHSFPRELIILE